MEWSAHRRRTDTGPRSAAVNGGPRDRRLSSPGARTWSRCHPHVPRCLATALVPNLITRRREHPRRDTSRFDCTSIPAEVDVVQHRLVRLSLFAALVALGSTTVGLSGLVATGPASASPLQSHDAISHTGVAACTQVPPSPWLRRPMGVATGLPTMPGWSRRVVVPRVSDQWDFPSADRS